MDSDLTEITEKASRADLNSENYDEITEKASILDTENSDEITEKASNLKEHDVVHEEVAQAERIEGEIKEELAENDGWIKILGNNQLMKKIITEGELNKRPTRGDICTVKFQGKLLDVGDAPFELHDSFTFQLGDSEVISGLDLAIPLMCKGELATIQVKPRFGYGDKGLEPLIPPNSALEYSIELLHFEPEKELEELSVPERRDIGNRKRERGNWWYGRGESTLAVQCYRRALEFLDDTEGGISYPKGDDTPEKIKVTEDIRLLFEDRLKTYNNMAAAQLKLQAYEPALTSVEAVLLCQPRNVKALFRKGKILAEKGELDKALSVLKLALELEPDNKAVAQEISRLRIKWTEEQKSEKLLYKRMFQTSNNSNQNSDAGSSFKLSFNTGLILGGAIIAVAGAMAYRFAT